MALLIFCSFLSISSASSREAINMGTILEHDDACLADNSSDCAVALLQRKAIAKSPLQEASSSGSDHSSMTSSTSLHKMNVLQQTIHANTADVLIEDPLYISLVKQVITSSGGNLYDEFKNKLWSAHHMLIGQEAQYWRDNYKYKFPNNALFTWGSRTANKLYVFAPGTDALCVTYAATLSHIASTLGVFAICPQFVHKPTTQESVMKPACAVEWAFSIGNFSIVVLGGHSGGASAVPATARVLMGKGIFVDAMAMQHPGAVPWLNVPGCQYQAHHASSAAYCAWYFPSDLMTQVSTAKLMIISGNFCEWTKVQNSNWFSNYACRNAGHCPSMTFTTPSSRPAQPPVTCNIGCPDAGFLANPSDCMVHTHGSLIRSTYLPSFNGKAIIVDSCSEHAFGASLESGLVEEGKPFVIPYLEYVITNTTSNLDSIVNRNGTNHTCCSTLNKHDMCLFSATPYTFKANPYYTVDGAVRLCKDAAKTFASGMITVVTKNL